jgi:DNA-binding XRE family transcriptional regulator
MPKSSSFRALLVQREPVAAARPSRSGSLANAVMKIVGEVDKPVSVVRLLMACGLTLRRSHELLNRLTAGEEVAAVLPAVADRAEVAGKLGNLGVEVEWRDAPDSVDVRAVRGHLNMTQSEFAARFAFDLNTVQNWEQGRNRPDRSTRILLCMIEKNPAIVEETIRTLGRSAVAKRKGRRDRS